MQNFINVYLHIRQRKAANYHNWEAGTRTFLVYLLEKWLFMIVSALQYTAVCIKGTEHLICQHRKALNSERDIMHKFKVALAVMTEPNLPADEKRLKCLIFLTRLLRGWLQVIFQGKKAVFTHRRFISTSFKSPDVWLSCRGNVSSLLSTANYQSKQN